MSTSVRHYSRGRKLIAMRDGQAGTSRYYHFDHQGTVQCLTDGAGNVTDRFASDAWGVPAKRTGTSPNKQWYVGNWGYRSGTRTNDVYVRDRYFAPGFGCWRSQDAWTGSLQAYPYAANSPSQMIDPRGTTSVNATLVGNVLCILDAFRRIEEMEKRFPSAHCWQGKLEAIAEMMHCMAGALKSGGYPGTGGAIANWLEGGGNTRVDYKELLGNAGFRALHSLLRERALEKVCLNPAFTIELPSTNPPPQMSDETKDLYFKYHWLEPSLFKVHVTSEPGASNCGRCGRRSVRVKLRYEFSDVFDWEEGEATPLGPLSIKFPQRWAVELMRCCRTNPESKPKNLDQCPADFSHFTFHTEGVELCCKHP